MIYNMCEKNFLKIMGILVASDTVTPESAQNEQNEAHIRHQGPRISIFCNF